LGRCAAALRETPALPGNLLEAVRQGLKLGHMTNLTYRDATDADIPAAFEVFRVSLMDLAARFNAPIPPPELADFERKFRHVLDTGFFRLAEADGEIVAHCLAIVRDHLWFLSSFWTLPPYQQQKIGQPMLQDLMQRGRDMGATVFSVWSSIDPDSVACYLKQGMVPGFQVLVFGGEIRQAPALSAAYTVEDLQRGVAPGIDLDVRGTAREVDHEFFAREAKINGAARQVMHAGNVVGYYYIQGNSVAPAAWTAEEHGEAVLSAALAQCAELSHAAGKPELRLVVPGINHTAIRVALQCGLRLKNVPHFLSTAPVGQLNHYIVSGPTLF